MLITKEQKEQAQKYLAENIKSGLNCSESVFNALIRAKILPLPESYTALVSGINGGAAGTGHTCGALSSAVMAVSAIYGRKDPIKEHERQFKSQNKSASTNTNDPTQDYRYYYMRRFNNVVGDFKKIMGTTQCQEMLDRNGGYWNEQRQAECVKCMETGLRLAIHYIEMEQEEADKLPYAENLFGWK